MVKQKKFKCYYDGKIFITKKALYSYMYKNFKSELGDLSPAHAYFDFRNNNTRHKGSCVICKKDTEFNENTEKYERFDKQSCRDKYREEFTNRMKRVYGKTTLLGDPEQQKKMLKSRSIAGVYHWSTGGTSDYVGSYELDALKYFDKVLKLKNVEVLSPAPQVFEYNFDNKNHFYIPDFLIVPYNLLVEIKGSNKHYRDRDYQKELLKERAVEKDGRFSYVKVLDKNYNELDKLIGNIKESN